MVNSWTGLERLTQIDRPLRISPTNLSPVNYSIEAAAGPASEHAGKQRILQ